MGAISPETWAELRRFVREQSPEPHDKPDADDMGGPSDMDADNMGKEPGAVAIEVKSEPTAGAKTCPTCGHSLP